MKSNDKFSFFANVTRQVLRDDNINKGISVSAYGGASRDPRVVLNDPNVQELIKLIQENHKKTGTND